GARFENDRPVDVSGASQSYVDARARYLFSLAAVCPGLAPALRDGDLRGAGGGGGPGAVSPTPPAPTPAPTTPARRCSVTACTASCPVWATGWPWGWTPRCSPIARPGTGGAPRDVAGPRD